MLFQLSLILTLTCVVFTRRAEGAIGAPIFDSLNSGTTVVCPALARRAEFALVHRVEIAATMSGRVGMSTLF